MSLLLAQFVPVWAPPVLGWGRKIRAGARPAGMEGNPRRGRVLSLPFVPSALCHLQGHPAGAKDSGDPSHSAVGNPLGIPSSSRENSAMGTGNRLELPSGAGGGRGGGGSRASIRSCSPEVAHGAGVTAGPWEGTSASGPDRSPGSARPRRRSGRDKIPTGMLEKIQRGWDLGLGASSGCGQWEWGTGELEESPGSSLMEFLHQEPSAIPQFHNFQIPQFHSSTVPSLGHGQSVAGASTALAMSPLGKKCFSPCLVFLEKLGRGREKPPLPQEALSPSSS